MIEILTHGSNKLFGMRISGKLLHEDYQQFVPELEETDRGARRRSMPDRDDGVPRD